MIAVDTSALMAILRGELEAAACAEAIATTDRTVISAATVVEALIVAQRRGLACGNGRPYMMNSILRLQASRRLW